MGGMFFNPLKTNAEKMCDFRLSIMLMKIRELNRILHYIHEKQGSYIRFEGEMMTAWKQEPAVAR